MKKFEITDEEYFDEEPEFTGAPYYESIDKLRFILAALFCINLFGFPTAAGKYVTIICQFTVPAFFILSGFLILRDPENRRKRILKAILKGALFFLIFGVIYIIIGIFFDNVSLRDVISIFTSPEVLKNLFILNIWPFFGPSIWCLMALVYAYIIILILDITRLIKLDWLIIIICLALSVYSGEFSKLFGFEFMGHTYLTDNFLTCALPYILMGGFIGRHLDTFAGISPVAYMVICVAAAGIMVLEAILLNTSNASDYEHQYIGAIILAPASCMVTLLSPFDGFDNPFWQYISGFAYKWVYYLSPVVGIGIYNILYSMLDFTWIVAREDLILYYALDFVGIMTFLFCLLLIYIYAKITFKRKYE